MKPLPGMTRPSFSGVFLTYLIVKHFFRFVPEMSSKILASNQQEANGIKNLSAHSKSAKELDAIVYELHQLHHERKANGWSTSTML